MSKFTVGQRVAVYDGIVRRVGTVAACEGEQIKIAEDECWYHPKQCRRLVKKPRREWEMQWAKAVKERITNAEAVHKLAEKLRGCTCHSGWIEQHTRERVEKD